MLEIMLPAMTCLCQRIFADQLPGGRHEDLDASDSALRDKLKSVPKSSKFDQSVFGMLDYQVRAKPNASTLAIEASIMFSQNKTKVWLDSKEEAEKRRIVARGRKDARKMKEDFKKRK